MCFDIVTIHGVELETYVKVTRTEHSIPPLRFHDSDGSQVGLNIARRNGRDESGFVDHERFVLDRSVGRQTVGWDLMFEHFEVFEGC